MTEQLPDHLEWVGPGWHPILERLHDQILAIDPDYSVVQVKEKFGGLRVYLLSEPLPVIDLVSAAEAESLRTCERCGQPGTQQPGYWIRTLCAECEKARKQ